MSECRAGIIVEMTFLTERHGDEPGEMAGEMVEKRIPLGSG